MVDKSAIRWQCRRGKLELDIVLRRFLDQCLDRLDEEELLQLQRLLGHDDDQLLDWLLGKSAPPDGQLLALVERVRNAGLSRPG